MPLLATSLRKCQYEKLRENKIKEREQAITDFGFVENFMEYKKKIGLSK